MEERQLIFLLSVLYFTHASCFLNGDARFEMDCGPEKRYMSLNDWLIDWLTIVNKRKCIFNIYFFLKGNYIYDRENRYGGKFFCIPHFGLTIRSRGTKKTEEIEQQKESERQSLIGNIFSKVSKCHTFCLHLCHWLYFLCHFQVLLLPI